MKRHTRAVMALVCAALVTVSNVTHAFAANALKVPTASTVLAATAAANASNTTASRPSKDETVYVNLDHFGNVKSTIVVNAFKVPDSGTIHDYGAYRSIKNLTNSETPVIRDRYMEWKADPSAGMFYYQGELEGAEIPWSVSIAYNLNGQRADPAGLGGASGKLGISIDAHPNPKAHPHFREGFMAQISVVLDSRHCRNIEAPDATVVTVGSKRTVTFVLMPGSSATYTLSADVSDFEMDGITLAATRASSSLAAGIGELQTGLTQMSQGIGQLADSTGQLRKGADQMSQGIGLLNNAASSISYITPSISAGMSDFQGGLVELGGGAARLAEASAAIRDGLGRLDENSYPLENGYSAIEAGLLEMSRQKAAVEDGVRQLERNKPNLSGVSGAADPLIAGCAGMQAANAQQIALIDNLIMAYSQPGHSDPALVTALEGVKAYAAGIGNGLTQVKGGIGQLGSSMTSMAWGIEQLYSTALKFGQGALELAGGASSLHGGVKELNAGLREYTHGIGELAENYAEFDAGIAGTQSGITSLSDGFSSVRYGVDSVFSAIGELKDGISSLDRSVAALPEGVQMLEDGQTQIGEALGMAGREIALATGSGDSAAVSFAAPGIVTPNSVQFVMRTPGIEKPEKPLPREEHDGNPGFFKRFLRLFGWAGR